jgi:GNAT superfamily N-acetyltransferase
VVDFSTNDRLLLILYDRSCYLLRCNDGRDRSGIRRASKPGGPGGDRRELLRRLFQRLSPEAIYRRFFSPISKPDYFQASLLRLDHHDREAIAAVAAGEVVGVAQYVRATGHNQAELAIVVEDGWQRQGLGTRLIAALGDRALQEGIGSFHVDIQGDNYGALQLFNRVAPGARIAFSGGVGEGEIPLGPR